MTALLLTLFLLSPPAEREPNGGSDGSGTEQRTLSALDDDDGPPRRPASRPAQEEAEDDLAYEEPRVVSPPGPGRIRIDLQAGAGSLGGTTLGTAGGELRIGLLQPVALVLGGEALLDSAGSAGWAARTGLRVQGDLSPAPFVELGAALLAGGGKAGLFGLGVAFPVTPRTGASLGARGLYTPADGGLGAIGVVALTFAP